MKFPSIQSAGTPVIEGDTTKFSYLDSYGTPHTETKPVLSAGEIVRMVRQRMTRFDEAPPGARESDESRYERKYISAQPKKILFEAWAKASNDVKIELEMMLDESSHFSLSDPDWLAQNARPSETILGDDGNPLDSGVNG